MYWLDFLTHTSLFSSYKTRAFIQELHFHSSWLEATHHKHNAKYYHTSLGLNIASWGPSHSNLAVRDSHHFTESSQNQSFSLRIRPPQQVALRSANHYDLPNSGIFAVLHTCELMCNEVSAICYQNLRIEISREKFLLDHGEGTSLKQCEHVCESSL